MNIIFITYALQLDSGLRLSLDISVCPRSKTVQRAQQICLFCFVSVVVIVLSKKALARLWVLATHTGGRFLKKAKLKPISLSNKKTSLYFNKQAFAKRPADCQTAKNKPKVVMKEINMTSIDTHIDIPGLPGGPFQQHAVQVTGDSHNFINYKQNIYKRIFLINNMANQMMRQRHRINTLPCVEKRL